MVSLELFKIFEYVLCNIESFCTSTITAASLEAKVYLFKVNIRNTRKKDEISSKLSAKTSEDVSNFVLVFLMLIFNIIPTFL